MLLLTLLVPMTGKKIQRFNSGRRYVILVILFICVTKKEIVMLFMSLTNIVNLIIFGFIIFRLKCYPR